VFPKALEGGNPQLVTKKLSPWGEEVRRHPGRPGALAAVMGAIICGGGNLTSPRKNLEDWKNGKRAEGGGGLRRKGKRLLERMLKGVPSLGSIHNLTRKGGCTFPPDKSPRVRR